MALQATSPRGDGEERNMGLDSGGPQTQVAGRLAEPPRRPPTAVGTGKLPPEPPPPPGSVAPTSGPGRYRMPRIRCVSLLMLALLLGAAGVGAAALPVDGATAIAGRAFVSVGLGAAGASAAWRAAPPPKAVDVLRAERLASAHLRGQVHHGRGMRFHQPNVTAQRSDVWGRIRSVAGRQLRPSMSARSAREKR